MIVYASNLNYFYSTLINDQRYFSAFGTKNLGDGRKIDNLINFLRNNNIDFKKIIIPNQIHSANVETVFFKNTGLIEKIEDVDGIITIEEKIVLRVVTADCLPIIYVDRSEGIIGISHNGWRGSFKKISEKLIKKMLALGAKISNIKVVIGPGIGQCCYYIDEDRYYQFKEEFDGYSEKIFKWFRGHWYLNLVLLNYLLLINYGIKKENIDFFPFCTRCDKKRFFSYRRDKTKEYGEMFSLIVKNY